MMMWFRFLLPVVVPLLVSFQSGVAAASTVRFATFNGSLNRNAAGQLISELSLGNSTQAQSIAQIIQRTRPDVLLINEFDYDAQGPDGGSQALLYFQENYLNVPQADNVSAISYPYVYTAPSNTGTPSGVDLDNDNSTDGPNDAFGFGFFPGQYGMVVLSQFPIDMDNVRTFQTFLWKDMPNASLPVNTDGSSYYSPEALDVFRLSSKSHWDLPIKISTDNDEDEQVVHFLVAHPTPPVFDGDEDRNGLRNYDEIRFWADYLSFKDDQEAAYMYDDNGVKGGFSGDHFVIAGDFNSDPFDGDSVPGAAQWVLEHPLVNTGFTPSSEGGPEQAMQQAGFNTNQKGDPAFDTADFGFNGVGEPDATPGNLRVDYVLPSVSLEITDGAVFWSPSTDDLFSLAAFPTSDHHLVWIDVKLPNPVEPSAATCNTFSDSFMAYGSTILLIMASMYM